MRQLGLAGGGAAACVCESASSRLVDAAARRRRAVAAHGAGQHDAPRQERVTARRLSVLVTAHAPQIVDGAQRTHRPRAPRGVLADSIRFLVPGRQNRRASVRVACPAPVAASVARSRAAVWRLLVSGARGASRSLRRALRRDDAEAGCRCAPKACEARAGGAPIRAGGRASRMLRLRSTPSLRPAGPDTVAALLDWYDRERRELPWRAQRPRQAGPYRVWLSEIMLQQTTVKAVIPYFEAFLRRWPTVEALAAAQPRRRSGGLGRARLLQPRAQPASRAPALVVERHGGRFPRSEAGAARAAGHRPLHGRRHRRHRLRRARDAGRRQHRARGRAPVRASQTPLPAAKPELRRLAQG